MPAEPKVKRRSRRECEEYRFDGHQARELEEKRNRGEISCAECRRLKMKCDKQIPCQSCQKRGCATLCPNGSLSTGQGTRFVLAATEHLHQRIAKLTGRIHQLEMALASLQAERSSEPHPLLREESIISNERWEEAVEEVEESTTGIIDAFGTLSISEHGVSRFFGPTGGSESLLVANQAPSVATSAFSTSSAVNYQYPTPSTSSSNADQNTTPPLFSYSFPFTPLGTPTAVHGLIESHLPSWSTATHFVETYLAHMLWVFPNVTRGQLLEDMLPSIYRRLGLEVGESENDSGAGRLAGDEYSGPHDLALLFTVFAIGALTQPGDDVKCSPSSGVNYSPSPYSAANLALGEHFYQLSCAALALQPVLEKPALATIQTLYLMSVYNALGGRASTSETTIEMIWGLVTLAAHLAQTIGLHRDSARWGLSPKMIQRRRMLFWDIFTADLWQSLTNGRPPTFSLPYIDCRFPDAHAAEGVQQEPASVFSIWLYRFTAECVADITGRTLTAEAPTYAAVMELDRKVREFSLPEDIGGRADDIPDGREGHGQKRDDSEGRNESFERFIINHIRETILLYLHRSFFAQALIDQPTNPLKSTYAPSFLASYRASSTILKTVGEHFNVWPNACALFWVMWTFAFSSAVVFGTIVTNGPRSPFAQSAMTELEQACILFSEASIYSPRAAKALPILCKLTAKARSALAAVQAETGLPPDASVKSKAGVEQETGNIEDDELTIFAGRTRFVSAKKAPPAVGGAVVSLPHPAPSKAQQPHSTNASTAGDWLGQGPSTTTGEQYVPAATTLHRPVPQYPYLSSQSQSVGHNANAWNGGISSLQSPCQQSVEKYPPDGSRAFSSMQMPLATPAVRQHPAHQHQLQPRPDSWGNYTYLPHADFPEQQPQQQPVYQAHTYLPNAEPVSSILDQRWSAFMEDSGLPEGVNYSHGR